MKQVAQIAGQTCPSGWLLDAEGRPTNDPNTRSCGSFFTNPVLSEQEFLRFSFRSSLKAAYTVHNLGFRCAKDL